MSENLLISNGLLKVTMKAFVVSGHFSMGRKPQHFEKEVAAEDSERAREIVLSILGSKHGSKRREITIAKVEEIEAARVTDPVARFKLGGSK